VDQAAVRAGLYGVVLHPSFLKEHPMKPSLLALFACSLVMGTGLAMAQPGAERCRAGGASAPPADCPQAGMGTHPGMGMHPGMAPGAHGGADSTPGWSMMSPKEQQEHRDKLKSMKTYEECKAAMDQHHEQMAARAKEKGRTMPAAPRHDACAGLKNAPK
jgi:hypothetical protein